MKDKSNLAFWDRVATIYGKFMQNNDAVYRECCDYLRGHIASDAHVLELACGTGQFTALLSKGVKSWKATDFSPKMVKLAAKANPGENVEYLVCDATATGFCDSTFDIVLVANALHIMPNPSAALAEIRRILKPNGILLAPTFIFGEHTPHFRMLLLDKLGFKSYNKWSERGLSSFIMSNGFMVKDCIIMQAKPLSECVVVAYKS